MTEFTKNFHHKPYETISPTLPARSYAEKTILVTGSSEGIGYAIVKAFALARASQVILVGRRPQALDTAVSNLSADLENASQTDFIPIVADVFDDASIRQLWQTLADRSIHVDGLILNAAKTQSNGEVDEEISLFTANVTANILLLDCFLRKQTTGVSRGGDGRGKFLINISSMAAHWNPMWPGQQAYCASKAAFASYIQHVATTTDVQKCLMFNVHPGAVYTSAAQRAGVPKEALTWDDADLVGAFCVWLSKQTFLHGRFVWINWDAGELIAMKDNIRNDPGMLKIGLQGIDGVIPEVHFAKLRERQQ